MSEVETLSTREVAEILGVKYASFHVWLREGLLGSRFMYPGQGRGRERRFALGDVVAAKIAKDVMTFVGDLSVARDCVKVFRQGSTEKGFHLAVQLIGDHWSIFWSKPGLEWGEVTMLVIPVQEIRKEMRGIFKAEPVKA